MRRFWKLLKVFMVATFSAQLAYRANFIGNLLSSLGGLAVTLLGLSLFFRQASNLGGWTLTQALLVVAFFNITQGVIAVVLQPNLNQIGEQVRTGAMDFTLLKPIDAQLSVSLRNLNLLRLPDMLLGLALLLWCLTQLHPSHAGVLLGLGLYLCALLLVYSLWFALSVTAFWFVKTQNVTELFNGVMAAANFPVSAFPAWARTLLTFVIPVAFVTNIPARAVLGNLPALLLWLAPVVALLALLLSRWLWNRALASYTSASS